MARPLIKSLVDDGPQALNTKIESLIFQLRGAMLLTGSRDLAALRQQKLYAA
jgi:isopentenyl diphosphate isomerase/L-lactate dehydrogenase-like FMN-dependent dehydrogenase